MGRGRGDRHRDVPDRKHANSMTEKDLGLRMRGGQLVGDESHLLLSHRPVGFVFQPVHLPALVVVAHDDTDRCPCRKPKPGLALQAAAALHGDLARSFVVGDKPCDIELGINIGARTILVRTGYGAHYDTGAAPAPDVIVENLEEAALWILNKTQ